MSPLLLIAAAAAGAYLLMSGGKKPTAPTLTGATIKVPTQPTSVTTPAGTVTLNPSTAISTQSGTTITVPEVTITPIDTGSPQPSALPTFSLPTPPSAIELAKDAMALSYEETQSIESDLPSDLYRKAMASQHATYVAAAAARLAGLGDTRAADLTLRVANWGH